MFPIFATLFGELTIGVVSGIVTSALIGLSVFLVRTIWKSRVQPWWENTLYQDARIDGEWTSTLKAESTDSDEEVVNVRQTGHQIQGDITCIAGPDKGRSYAFVGCIKNQILSGYYWNIDRTSIDSGSFSLHLEDNGSALRGYSVYYNDATNMLVSRSYSWVRRKVPGGESTIEAPIAPSDGVQQS
jgi:hypothetical protein